MHNDYQYTKACATHQAILEKKVSICYAEEQLTYMPEQFSLQLIEHIQLTSQVFALRFTKPEDFTYLAGQFVQCFIPDSNSTQSTFRLYSFSSAPHDDYLEFCIKLLPDGIASPYLHNLKPGDELIIGKPRGVFIANDPSDNRHYTGIATGTGIAPILGMIRSELEYKKSKQEFHLLFGVRTQEDLFWQDKLEKLAQNFENFSYTITLSQPEAGWQHNTGRVTQHLSDLKTDSQFYICGGVEMVKEVRAKLLEKNIPQTQIHMEIF